MSDQGRATAAETTVRFCSQSLGAAVVVYVMSRNPWLAVGGALAVDFVKFTFGEASGLLYRRRRSPPGEAPETPPNEE